MAIPKITHQIWFQGWDKLPEKFHGNVSLLRELNPNYEHKTWDEHSLRAECRIYSEACAQKFDSLEHMIMKIDLGRYVVLHNYGGISVDTDMKPLKPLDTLPFMDNPPKGFMISKSAMPLIDYVNNGILICKPYHPIMRNIIDHIVTDPHKDENYISKEFYIHNTTGPVFMDRIIRKFKGDIHVIDNHYFEPCLSTDPYCKVSPLTILDHQHELSWFSPIIKYLVKVVSYIVFFIYHYFFIIVLALIIVNWRLLIKYTRLL